MTFNTDGCGTVVVLAGIALMALGAALAKWVLPWLWALIRPWLHAITG